MDAQIYILLAKKGPLRAREISRTFKTSKPQLYRSLKNLESKGIVSVTLEHPAKFLALPFEKSLDLLAKAKMKKAMEEAQQIQENKSAILANWQKLDLGNHGDAPSKFMVIEGRNTIYSKIQQMIQETNTQFSAMTTAPGMLRADQFGLFDTAFTHPLKPSAKFRFLAEISEKNIPPIKALLKEIAEAELNFEGRTPELGLKLFPRMIMRDQEEILFFINSQTDPAATEQDSTCLWTNCKDLVQSFSATFEDYWRNATDVRQVIAETEKGKTPSKTFYIDIAKTAKETYENTTHKANKEIIMMTSSDGITTAWNAKSQIKEWAEKGVSIKIMAPLTNENIDAARHLSKYCEIRHVPTTYLETTIVDGTHLFQFRNPAEQGNRQDVSYFENTFYSSNPKHVEKLKKTLYDVWERASAASIEQLSSIFPSATDEMQPSRPLASAGTSAKQDVLSCPVVIEYRKPRVSARDENLEKLKKTITSQTETSVRDVNIARAIWGQAIVHPPDQLNMPPILIQAFRINQSTFGIAEDNLIINMLLQTQKGKAFVPVAFVQDNPKAGSLHRAVFAGLPAGQNIKTVAENELEIWSQGNNFFAGWTVDIPLLPLPHSLPPSSLMLEGHGTPKLRSYAAQWPSGYKTSGESYEAQAFATFVNQSWRYAGPANDGALSKDILLITTSPEEKKEEQKHD